MVSCLLLIVEFLKLIQCPFMYMVLLLLSLGVWCDPIHGCSSWRRWCLVCRSRFWTSLQTFLLFSWICSMTFCSVMVFVDRERCYYWLWRRWSQRGRKRTYEGVLHWWDRLVYYCSSCKDIRCTGATHFQPRQDTTIHHQDSSVPSSNLDLGSRSLCPSIYQERVEAKALHNSFWVIFTFVFA